MSTHEQLLIVTAQPEFSAPAVTELKRLDKQLTQIDELAPGITLCHVPLLPNLIRQILHHRLTFVRHLAPVQATVPLHNTSQDLSEIAATLAELPGLALFERGTRFAVQTRLIQTDKTQGERAYTGGQVNQALATLIAEETGATEHIKKPQVVLSLLITMQTGYLGISTVEENLSSWPGGTRHFAHTPKQISRAEFKLLEALEVFDLELPSQGRTLDLGAAPGGWTRLALDTGLQVVAVDPARLDVRLEKQRGLEHYRGYAENYLKEATHKRYRFDCILNDMRMDARDAARLLVQAARCLKADGFVLSVFKLPHATPDINPLLTLKDALNILSQEYHVVQARQLFHNRQEVTVVAAQPKGLFSSS